MNSYAYLGEVTPEEFSEIRKAFPAIVGIDTVTVDTGKMLIVIGVSKELSDDVLSDDVIELYQLIVALWGNEEARDKAWRALGELGI